MIDNTKFSKAEVIERQMARFLDRIVIALEERELRSGTDCISNEDLDFYKRWRTENLGDYFAKWIAVRLFMSFDENHEAYQDHSEKKIEKIEEHFNFNRKQMSQEGKAWLCTEIKEIDQKSEPVPYSDSKKLAAGIDFFINPTHSSDVELDY